MSFNTKVIQDGNLTVDPGEKNLNTSYGKTRNTSTV